MSKILLSLGSNTAASRNMALASEALTALPGTLRFSPTLWTEPIGMVSPRFLNRLAWLDSDLTYEQLHDRCKAIERQLGREKTPEKRHIVPIDIDILQYDQQRYKPGDWQRYYVSQLLSMF